MPDETKSPAPPPPGDPKPGADQPATPGGVKATPSGSVQSETQSTAEKPATAAPPPKPAPAAATPAGESKAEAKPAAPPAAAAKPAHPAPPKPTGPTPTAWDSPLVAKYKREFGSGLNAFTFLGQNYLEVDRSLIPDILRLLRDDEQFNYCVDITAVHYPKREKPFDVVWILYSFERNERLRVRTQIADGESLPSSVPIWTTANWLEREVFDMFGIKFDGHPDMKRILLPDGWKGHPLRKDYGIIQQDNEWVQINLGIESGQ
jgi:NADH-quinone oxidoreductase subunit C